MLILLQKKQGHQGRQLPQVEGVRPFGQQGRTSVWIYAPMIKRVIDKDANGNVKWP